MGNIWEWRKNKNVKTNGKYLGGRKNVKTTRNFTVPERKKRKNQWEIFGHGEKSLCRGFGVWGQTRISVNFFFCASEIEQNRSAQLITPRACLQFKTH